MYIYNVIKKGNTMNELEKLISLLADLIPNGTEQEFILDGVTYKLKKTEDEILIEGNEPFDDTETKELVSKYKENIKNLDDDLFVEVVDEISKKIDLKKFNELLDLENYTEEQANEVEDMIDTFTDIICLNLQHKIQHLVEVYDNF